MTTQPKPDDSPWMIPYLIVQDADVSLAFYQKAFGFEPANILKGNDGSAQYVEMRYKDIMIMFGPEGAWGSPIKSPKTGKIDSPVSLYVYCDDVDEMYQHLDELGVEIAHPPETMFWGDRIFPLVDPDGHRWTFASKVSEPSSNNET